MLICITCKKEMKCEENGINARWNGTHTYPGDSFKCPVCGYEVLNTGNCNAFYNEDHREKDIYMTESYEYHMNEKHKRDMKNNDI